jgi:penicillin amidase
VHRASFFHPLGGVAPAARALFDRGPVSRPGDGSSVDATYFGGSSFDQLAGASYREIFDLSDWDNALSVNVPGQSGQPGSPHYDDLLPLWTRGQYFPLLFSKPSVDRETTDVLELKP